MKNIFTIAFILGFTVWASAQEKLTCSIEMPCGWLEPVPVEPYSWLGYCVDRIEGDQSQVTVFRSDGNGVALDPFILSVKELSKEKIFMSNADESIVLSGSKYGEFLAAGLLIKTERDPAGLGFFTLCELK